MKIKIALVIPIFLFLSLSMLKINYNKNNIQEAAGKDLKNLISAKENKSFVYQIDKIIPISKKTKFFYPVIECLDKKGNSVCPDIRV
ncbi:MAG: hypothetical protein N2558_04525 [Patescibacteria group bacterium]|nr:hypothetical protein [Patescibacteria group bacterium]